MTRVPVALLAVVGVLAVGTATVRAPSAEPATRPSTTLAPVEGAVGVCPELLRAGGDVTSSLTLGTVEPGDVRARSTPLTATASASREVLAGGGTVNGFGTPGDQAVAVAVTAVGEGSGELEIEQVSRGVDGVQRGLANVRCESTSADTWFLGGATTAGIENQLMLVNPYDDDALVDLELFGQNGRIDAPGVEGLVVKGRERKVVNLSDLAPEEKGLAVHVLAREGRIAPAMRDARSTGSTPLGVDWVPRAGRPAELVDLPGIPPGNGRRLLYLAAPGDDEADVSVELVFENEKIVPVGLESVGVGADRVRLIELSPLLEGRPASVRVRAEVAPVLAAVFVENRARFNPIREFAYIGATPPLTGPALITDARLGTDVDTLVLLSAPEGVGRVRLRLMPLARLSGRISPPRDLTIPEGRLLVVRLSEKRFSVRRPNPIRPFVLTPLPGSAPVYATRVISEIGLRGPLFTALGAVSARSEGVVVPPVVDDVSVLLQPPPARRSDEDDLLDP
jgi:hypothetical protein